MRAQPGDHLIIKMKRMRRPLGRNQMDVGENRPNRLGGLSIGVAVLIMAVTACSTGRVFTTSEDGAEVELGAGEEIELVLPGNPSTGYTWVVAEVSPVLEMVGEPEFQPESDLVGAPGEYRFRFVGREAGAVNLLLTYERPFEEAEPLDTFAIQVTVG
jgi:inhibitor of cysteine peptidase